jgi:arsenate reductase
MIAAKKRDTTMPTTIYHNPRCSKSRETLELLKEHEGEPTIVEYLETPPSKTELNKILKMLGLEPRDLMRQKEPEYKQLKLDNPKLTRDQLIEAMVQHPRLIERPIVIKGNKAALGRPPERVLDIL